MCLMSYFLLTLRFGTFYAAKSCFLKDNFYVLKLSLYFQIAPLKGHGFIVISFRDSVDHFNMNSIINFFVLFPSQLPVLLVVTQYQFMDFGIMYENHKLEL